MLLTQLILPLGLRIRCSYPIHDDKSQHPKRTDLGMTASAAESPVMEFRSYPFIAINSKSRVTHNSCKSLGFHHFKNYSYSIRPSAKKKKKKRKKKS